MRKAINFDINTKKYEEYANKKASVAYKEIRKFLNKMGFEHRQGSGYISRESLTNGDITAIIAKMSFTLEWLKFCVKEFDITNIGKQHSVLNTINNPPANSNSLNIDNINT